MNTWTPHFHAAINMMNEIHRRMGLTWVYQMRLERMAVDRIAEKHTELAYQCGYAAGLAALTKETE